MARCTAPSRGHRTASGAADCPACRYRYGRYGGSSSLGSSSTSSSYAPYPSLRSGGGSGISSSSTGRSVKPRWSRPGSPVFYTNSEVLALTPFRQTVENRPRQPDRRDVFLCHAWNDRKVAAKELHDLLEAKGVSVWFSEKDVILGTPLLREIDRGLANSRVGIVLVTPAFLERVQGDGSIADKELSTLLARDVLIPVVHDTTYEALREVSPMLASRSGLTIGTDQTMADVAAKIAELVAP